MSEKQYIVYKHQNLTNDKVYIGITSTSIEKRSGANGVNYKKNVLFYRAILKYGWDGFAHIVLFQNLSLEDAAEKEKKLISELRANDPQYGYNISSGGESGNAGVVASEELRERISQRVSGSGNPMYGRTRELSPRYGVKLSEEIKKKISEGNKGRFVSEEARANMGKAMKRIGRWKGSDNPNYGKKGGDAYGAKKVRCIETGEEYECIKYAAIDKGVLANRISLCCKGKAKTTGGFHWEYI